jgi:non-canonical poly(A) RNA polymerase PAPD5/7
MSPVEGHHPARRHPAEPSTRSNDFAPEPSRLFTGNAGSDLANRSFTFRAHGDSTPSFPPEVHPPTGPRYGRVNSPRLGDRRDRDGGETGYNGGNRRGGRRDGRGGRGGARTGDRPRWQRAPKAHSRDILRQFRSPTPEQLAVMNDGGAATGRFMAPDAISDSEEEDMDVDTSDEDQHIADSASDEEMEEPPRKKQAVKSDSPVASEVPRWSNPDPYTVLTPPGESQGKKKDTALLKLIRKARIEASESSTKKNAVAANDDFISLDFGELERPRRAEDSGDRRLPDETRPRFSHRDNLQRNSLPISTSQSAVDLSSSIKWAPGATPTAPGTDGSTTSFSLPPPPGLSDLDRSRPRNFTSLNMGDVPPRRDDQWPPPDTDSALGSRKRTHEDEIKAPAVTSRARSKLGIKAKFSLGSITPQWAPRPGRSSTPWSEDIDHSRTQSMSHWLHKEIYDFYDYARPRSFEDEIREGLLQRLNDIIRQRFPHASIRPFGSFAAGMYLPNADMDVVLVSDEFLRTGRMTYNNQKDLYLFKDLIEKNKVAVGRIDLIAKAKVPLVKYVDRLTGLKVDVSFENDSGLVTNTTFKDWKKQYPAMPIIAMLVKHFLGMRNLNEVHTGGLGGFSVICLVVSLLEHMPEVRSGDLIPEDDLGQILMEFLDLYGKRFDLAKTAITFDQGYTSKVRGNPTITFVSNWSRIV